MLPFAPTALAGLSACLSEAWDGQETIPKPVLGLPGPDSEKVWGLVRALALVLALAWSPDRAVLPALARTLTKAAKCGFVQP